MDEQLKKITFALFLLISVVTLLGYKNANAAQQYQGLCSLVKIEIVQELALERIGFLAELEVTNNEGDASITDFSSALTFHKREADGTLTDASDLFFIQPPTIRGVSSIDGAGIIKPSETAYISWFIIPKISAGGVTPDGELYEVGVDLAGSIYGLEISPDVLYAIPDTITVKPEPQLDITYFQPRDVDGDDPFTPNIVESPIPFTLGVLVRNVGYGRANKVTIDSEQPRIVENQQGLLVVPRLIGSRVDDQPTDHASLKVDLGDIEPADCRKGAWDMITTLSGEFTEFKASYTHAPELGGRDTSVIKDLNAYFMVHEVKNDQPGRDNLLDFLAETQGGEQLIPDTLYESDCNTVPVNHVETASVIDYQGLTTTVQLTADVENWIFIRVNDPAQAKFKIASVVRSDGKVLNKNNYWTHIRYRKGDNAKLTWLNIFDFVALGEYTYKVTYEPIGSDSSPPNTTLLFNGAHEESSGKHYVLPDTQLFFIADDESPVGTYYKLDGAADFKPAYPFTLLESGEHILEYYSADSAGNEEIPKFATVVLADDYPAFNNFTTDTEQLFITGESISVRPTSIAIGYDTQSSAASMTAIAEVYRGIDVRPTITGIPSSPTQSDSATLFVGGDQVDYFRYRLGLGAWSVEYPVSTPISLSGLSGNVNLSIKARNQHGAYHADDDALEVNWNVSGAALPISINHGFEHPSRSTSASFTVSGSEFFCYRIDGKFYQPELQAVGGVIQIDRLAEGQHTIEVLPRATVNTPCPEDEPGTLIKWSVDRHYGMVFPVDTRIYLEDLGAVTASHVEFVWDGRDSNGAVAPPGWYTVKVTLKDGLNQLSSVINIVQVGDILPDGNLISDAGNASQMESHAYGDWVVWQDQRNGSWNIWAQNIVNTGAMAAAVTSSPFNNERPRTDGEYVVWESRQADGSWDIHAKKLGSADAIFAITSSTDYDERKPVVYWPWVVYQRKPLVNPGAPWQLIAYNMQTHVETPVDATTQDQLDPELYQQRLVWQDWRDVGLGEVYMKDLKTGEVRRITNQTAGQYHPVIFKQWIVWADNRNTQLDLYGYNLLRNSEVRLTNTPGDETRPRVNGKWVVYQEDSSGEQKINIRILHLDNLASVQLTNIVSEKEKPGLASGKLVWSDKRSGVKKVMIGSIPNLQPVFNNQNTVAVTDGMVAYQVDAFTLLELWSQQAGVTSITRYTSVLPQPVAETVSLEQGIPTGNNFGLQSGSYLWVKFDSSKILDLGLNSCHAINLVLGVNVFSFACVPDHYTAYQLIREIGIANINSVRVLDSATGNWAAASVVNGEIIGDDFIVPNVSVLMLDMNTSLDNWKPGE